ncbi:protein mono-ADP-ribosyltransferase PARP12-like isoform X2 [Penaeus monodon]|uniref:protein mono-ADP-ribosyltransferase PARP12-like isoform X2 n=1 Tax=Penaeus monodon TaxID=6687 RepID=UPI0018A70C31|nr:protein mono-ADP-ribosyltransferase PARP12-like isoform X2 [Penaeus monodon]
MRQKSSYHTSAKAPSSPIQVYTMSAEWNQWRRRQSPNRSEDSEDDGYENSDRRAGSPVYDSDQRRDPDWCGKSARYANSGRRGHSPRYADSDRHGNPARYEDPGRQGHSPRYADSDNYREKTSEYEVNTSTESSDDDDEGQQYHGRYGQPAVSNQRKSYASRRPVHQESEEEESEEQGNQWLVNFLAGESKFKAKKLAIIKQGIQLNELESMIQQNTHIFQETEEDVYLRPQLKICVWFLSPRGCSARSSYKCSDLHICPQYISGSCNDKNCPKGHDLITSHNIQILQPYFLRYINSNLLTNILQISLADIDNEEDNEPLIICEKYNQDQCFDKKCQYFHFCKYHLESRLKCNGRRCKLNHSFTAPACIDLLERKGIDTNESPKDILNEIFTCFPELEKSNRQTSVKNKSSHQQASPSLSPPRNRRAPPRAPIAESQWTTEATELEGTVYIPEICYNSVENKCYNERCQRLHSNLPFHWQVSVDGVNWINLHKSHVGHLEKEFSDPNTIRTALPVPKGKDVHKKLLKLLGPSKCVADFEDMQITSPGLRTPLQLRRIALEQGSSDAEKLFLWYFLDGNNKWVQYGEVDTTKRTFLKSSITSEDIEKHYIQNPQKLMTFKNDLFTYELDFVQMKQENQSTNVVRDVRRRPVPPQMSPWYSWFGKYLGKIYE